MDDHKLLSVPCNGRTEVLSRTALLEWINSILNTDYKKIEELCSGVAYCQIVELLYPNYIGKSKIKTAAKLEYEYTQNFKLLQLAFNKLDVDRTIPIERLVQGRVQDNLNFLQWFRKFYDSHVKGGAGANLNLHNTNNRNGKTSSDGETTIKNHSTGSSTKNVTTECTSRTPPPEMQTPPIFPVDYLEAKATLCELKDLVNIATMEKEFYLNKLTKIESLIRKTMKTNKNDEFCARILKILATKDDTNKTTKIVQK